MRRAGPLLVAAAATSLAAAALALAANPIGDTVRGPASGFHGTVYKGPITPVCTINKPCEAPAAGITLTFRRPGAASVRTKSAADGSYRVLLPAAIYTVGTDFGSPGVSKKVPFPRRVKVRRGFVDRLDFHIDTGIR